MATYLEFHVITVQLSVKIKRKKIKVEEFANLIQI